MSDRCRGLLKQVVMLMPTIEEELDRRDRRRLAAEHRHLCRLERLEKKAEPMIGILRREGADIFYCWPAGGKYFESASHSEVVQYLARNRYIRV